MDQNESMWAIEQAIKLGANGMDDCLGAAKKILEFVRADRKAERAEYQAGLDAAHESALRVTRARAPF